MKDILVVDDHPLILKSTCDVLQKLPFVKEITALTNGTDACKKIKEKRFDAYILDLELSDMSGFDLIKLITQKHGDAKIIICTMHEEPWIINRLLEVGVDGVLMKRTSLVHWEEALESIFTGERYFCPRFDYLIQDHSVYSKKLNGKKALLTNRELEVLKHISKGLTSVEIAEKLSVEPTTIDTHRNSIITKLGARNTAHMVFIAVTGKLIDPF